MKHEENVCTSEMVRQVSLVRVALARRMRSKKTKPHHGHHRRSSYSNFMMDNMSARSIF
jgi:hypothetical protein